MKYFKSSVLKMDKRIYLVFFLVISVAIANAVLSTIKIRNNKNSIFEITQSTNPTLENLEEFNLLITRSRMFISNWVYLPNNNNDKSNLVQLNNKNYPELKQKLTRLTKTWRSDGHVEKVEKLFKEYETVIREQEKIMKSLVKFDDYQDPYQKFLAEEQLESEIIPSTNRMMVNLRELITFKKAEASRMQDAMLQDNEHLLMIVFTLAVLIIVSVMSAGIYLMKSVILPVMRVRELLLQMSAGELPEVSLEPEHSALGEMKTALYQLREGLQRTSSFAGEIGKGNFNAGFQPLSDKDVLGSALLEMRDKLKYAAEELRQINDELVVQSGKLKYSETTLRRQSETLQLVNTELENKALLLEEKNMAVEDAHTALAFKADQLERSNKYKSDFLANMSHELRTPLNSVLILARLLAENQAGNMNTKQVEHAKVIHKSGSDLLVIINDILDLSKIEAGKLQLQKDKTEISEICTNMVELFMEVSNDKNINFSSTYGNNIPQFIYTDRVRIEQVLKNLLGNAFKFTPVGGNVILKVEMADEIAFFQNEKLRNAKRIISFSVCDTGIGIPEDKQRLIFDAFNQADSSITRKFGGTGLGLAICRQLSNLLGGEINLSSVDGQGSVFSLFLSADVPENITEEQHIPLLQNDFSITQQASKQVLLVCDDSEIISCWKTLLESKNYIVTDKGTSENHDILFIPEFIIIDASLPDKEYILKIKYFKESAYTSRAPVICRSLSEFIPEELKSSVLLHATGSLNESFVTSVLQSVDSINSSALSVPSNHIYKPVYNEENYVDHKPKIDNSNKLSGIKVLIADDDIRNIYSMTSVFEDAGAEVICAMDGFEAVDVFKSNPDISLILMDVMMPGKDGLQAIREIRLLENENCIPIVAVTAKAMRDDRMICIDAGASEYITKPVNIEILLKTALKLLNISCS